MAAFLPSCPLHLTRVPIPRRVKPCVSRPYATQEPSIPLPHTSTTGAIPSNLSSTTIYHTIPSNPPHLPQPIHPADNDGYILALSLANPPWLRARFIRTKAYNLERRSGRRIYRGAHGTSGATGPSAPTKPKPLCIGVTDWQKRLFSFGPRALPVLLDSGTLVTKRPTALGKALSDSPDLCITRAAELFAAPVPFNDRLIIPGVGRASSGRMTGVFITQLAQDFAVSRLERVALQGFVPVDIAVTDSYIVVLCHAHRDPPPLLAIFRSQSPTKVDARTSMLIAVPSDGGAPAYMQLPVLVTALQSCEYENGELRASILAVSDVKDEIELGTLADLRSGRYWISEMGSARVAMQTLRLEIIRKGEKAIMQLLRTDRSESPDFSVISPARPVASSAPNVYTIYDHTARRSGLAVVSTSGVVKYICEHEGQLLSGPVLSPDDDYVNVFCSSSSAACLQTFELADITKGPVHEATLDAAHFGSLHISLGGVWTNDCQTWSEEGAKIVKSAYEIFDDRDWNDINSGFSSLGLGQ